MIAFLIGFGLGWAACFVATRHHVEDVATRAALRALALRGKGDE